MANACFLVPYEVVESRRGRLLRRLEIASATSAIHAAGGDWHEAEYGDPSPERPMGQALVEVYDFSAAGLKGLASQWQRVADPESVLRDGGTRAVPRLHRGEIVFDGGGRTAHRPLADLVADRRIRARAAVEPEVERLIALADRDGYVKLIKPWPAAAPVLVECARRGYPLDRVSTGTFPTTGVLDDFNRGTGIGANWTADPWGYGQGNIGITANQASGGDDWGGWNPATYVDSEVYATIATKDATGEAFALNYRRTALFNGYWVQLNSLAGADTVQMIRVDAQAPTVMGADISQEFAAGEKLGGEVITSTHGAYRFASGSWAAIGSRTDATHAGAGNIGMYIDLSGLYDDFGGGTVVVAGAPVRLLSLMGVGT